MRHRLTLALLFIAVASVSGFVAHARLPVRASAESALIDAQFRVTFIVLATLFLLAHLVLGFVIWRRRSAERKSAISNRMEAVWAVIIVLIFAALGISGSRVLAATRTYPEHDAIHLEATGMQFQWYFRYPGADGRFGETKPEMIDASVGNPLGIDPADRDGNDDVVSTSAVVPVGHTVELTLHAQDVIHSFFLPNMRVKQDAVPGMDTHLRFTPTTVGDYEVACAELCGLGHYRMNTRLRVVSEGEYAAWLSEHQRSAR
ncbi:MAG TPA: cytochrome C oxidase subunit II [Terriglobales bacterium]